MTKLASYYLPGLYVEDHSIDVPLDWRGLEPMMLAIGDSLRRGARPAPICGAPESIKLFYRVVCAPENVSRELPLLVYLQGGPGGESPRLSSPTSDGWVAEAIKHFRVILPDQRGCGRSSRVDGRTMERIRIAAEAAGRDHAAEQAAFLKRFLAPSIVRDLEYLRCREFGGAPWVTLGQSYGGFLTLSYLSSYPEGIAASFTCGGIPHIPADADKVYAHTFPRMAAKTEAFYRRYPLDRQRVAALADHLERHRVTLPDASPLTVRRLQSAGSDFGMQPAFERMHNLLDLAFTDDDGSLPDNPDHLQLHEGFKLAMLARTSSADRPLYWTLQEFIYADGTCAPARWAAERTWAEHPAFATDARPLMFCGEAAFPWMFEEDPALAPFADAVAALMEDTEFDRVYGPARLAANTVPLQAAVYHDDLYVDAGLQLDTLANVGASHAWVTNEFEHDGLHGSRVFTHLFELARDRGDLERIWR